MVTLSLDTSELVHVLRSRSRRARARFDEAVLTGLPMVAAAPVAHEHYAGALASAFPLRRLGQVRELLTSIKEVDFASADAEASGRLAAALREAGTPIGDIDTLIAGQALARGWTVVTRNIRHFGRVAGLPLIDWAVGPGVLSGDEIAARVASKA